MSPTANENKPTLGLKDLYYALVTQDDSSAYAAGTPKTLAPAISASQAPSVNSKTIYADDQAYEALVSEGETKIDLEVTGIPTETLAELLGKAYDASTGRMFDNGGVPPDIALGFRAQKSNGKYLYRWYLKGKFSAPSEEHATQTDSPEPKTPKLAFTAVKTTRKFTLPNSVVDGVKVVRGDEDATNFSGTNWFTTVQVPVVGSPAAFTATPVPADGATGQSVGVAPAITFTNPLASGEEEKIMLLRTSTAAPIAVTRTINAARTVVTLTPTGNLAAAANHMIVLSSPKSIYGQSLGNTVFDFTTT